MASYADVYNEWVTTLSGDSQLQRELSSLSGDAHEAARKDQFGKSLTFGTGGMRGKMGAGTNRMNIYTIRRATQALADVIHASIAAGTLPNTGTAPAFVIGHDTRNNSARFAKEAALMLCKNGIAVHLYDGPRPVALVSYGVLKMRAMGHDEVVGGICITASHNPMTDNGYKVYGIDGAQMEPAPASEVERRMQEIRPADCVPMDEMQAIDAGLLMPIDASMDDAYIEHIKSLSEQPALLREHGRELTIVYSALFGAGNIPVRRMLQDMGVYPISVIEQEAPNGNFPGLKTPNPQEPESMQKAMALAKTVGADICFATDPDCDRLGVCMRTEDGYRVLTGNQVGCLLLHYILKARKEQNKLPKNGVVIQSIVSTDLGARIADGFSVRTVQVLTGFKYTANEIGKLEANPELGTFLFGFEESNGYLSAPTLIRDKDACNASLLVAELALSLKLENKTLADRLIEIYEEFGFTEERSFSQTYTSPDWRDRVLTIMTGLHKNSPAEIGGVPVVDVLRYREGTHEPQSADAFPEGTVPDVLYFKLEGGAWVCMRPSGTEPKMKLYVGTLDTYARRDQAIALAKTIEQHAKAMIQ